MKDIFEILPRNHFGRTMDKAIKALVSGESVCVYSMPGGGTHYFLQLSQRILNEDYQNLKTFFFDGYLHPNGLNKVIRLTLSQGLHFNSQTDFYQQLQVFLKTKKIIILLGHVNEVLVKQPRSLEYLLKLRDYYPTRLAVLSNCDHTIIRDFSKYYSLGKTIFSNLFKIPPFDSAGTKRILETNKKVLGYQYPQSVINKIYRLSDGNPALIKHLGKAVDELGETVLIQPKILINYPSLKIKLNDINEVILSESKETLTQIGIIDQRGKIFSPLVVKYFKNFELENIEEIVPGLTPQEKKIFTYLLKNKGKTIDFDRVFLLMELAEENYSLWAIYKLISRLKQKIKKDFLLENIKGRGYLLKRK